MVRGFHCVFSTYGFWLPNDPRGSGSNYVAALELLQFGPATPVNTRRSVAAKPHDVDQRQRAKSVLSFPPVQLTDDQILFVAEGFQTAIVEGSYIVYACAIMPDHAHLVIGPHRRPIRQIVGHLKSKATRSLRMSGIWHVDDRPVWGEHGWNVFLDTVADMHRAIEYADRNPTKQGRPRQRWSFVTEYRG